MFEKLKIEKFMWEGSEQRKYSWPRFLVEMFVIELQMRWNVRKCRSGHIYENETGNPETGSFSMDCSRCGHNVSGYW